MPKSLKWLISVAILLILLGGAGSLLTAKSAMGSGSDVETKTADAGSIRSVNVQAENGEITTAATGDADQATVEWSGYMKGDDDRLSVEEKDGVLSVKLDPKPFKLFSFDLFDNKKELEITLPDKAYDSFHVKTHNGKIEVNQLKSGDIDIQANNGQAALSHLTADQIHAGMDNGQLTMKAVTGDVTGRTDNGEIRLTTTDLDCNINLTTNNGRITVQTDKQPTNAVMDAHADHGIVSIFGRENRKTVYGDADHHIKLTTNNGMITVEEQK